MGWRGRGRWLQLECNTRLAVVMEEERRFMYNSFLLSFDVS